ncbi:MAG: HAD family phosphatase [Clostridia bacterium]|nr:HAD family phosphatase [Clostridia bacterium]
MKKTYIFDFDGTLVDSMPTWSAKMLYVLKESDTAYPDDIIKTITPLGDFGSAKYFQETLGCPWELERILTKMDEYALPKYRNEIVLKEGVKAYLEWLRLQGISLHVLTASPHKMVDPCLKRCGVFDWFDNVWSCDDFSMTKSNPEIYRQAAERIGVSVEDCVFFDDNIHALQTAQRAGMFAVGVFDPSAAEFEREMRACADVYVETLVGIKNF